MTIFDQIAAAAAEDVTCMLCSYVMIDPVQLPYCSHAMCRGCVLRISRHSSLFVCPMRCNLPAGSDGGVPMMTVAAVQALPAHPRVAEQVQWHAALVLASGFEADAWTPCQRDGRVRSVFREAGLQMHLPRVLQMARADEASSAQGGSSMPQTKSTANPLFQIANIIFESLGSSERLRVSVRRHSSRDAPAFAVWAERKSSKEQWELEVDDVAQHCDTPVPVKVVLSRLKKALTARVDRDEVGAAAAAAGGGGGGVAFVERELSDVDAEVPENVVCSIGEGNTLLMKLCVFLDDDYCPVVTLPLQLKDVDATERLAARLRDAEEEIARMRAALALSQAAAKNFYVPSLSLRTTHAVSTGTLLQWNTAVAGVTCPDVFALDEGDTSIVRVRVRGIYQLHVSVTNRNTTGGQYLCVLVNGTERCRAYESNGNAYQNQVTMFDIMDLEANDAITVRPYATHTTHADAMSNRFNLTLLQRL